MDPIDVRDSDRANPIRGRSVPSTDVPHTNRTPTRTNGTPPLRRTQITQSLSRI
jgi:hypothetical protein